jgi:hypothetical protein
MKMPKPALQRVISLSTAILVIALLFLGARFHFQEKYLLSFWIFLGAFTFSMIGCLNYLKYRAMVRYYVVSLPVRRLKRDGGLLNASIKAAEFSGTLKQCCDHLNNTHKPDSIIIDASGQKAGRRISGRWLAINQTSSIPREETQQNEIEKIRATKTLTLID